MKTNLQRIVSKYKWICPSIAKQLNVNKSWIYRVVKQDTTNTNEDTRQKIYNALIVLWKIDKKSISSDELFSNTRVKWMN